MFKVLSVASSAVALCLTSMSLIAMVQMVPLREMVAESELIVVGEVERIDKSCDPCNDPSSESLYKATVRVEDTLKGDQARQVSVYFTQAEASPHLERGQRCILLLRRWKDGYATTNGYAGKFTVRGNIVSEIYAPNEAAEQSLDVIVKRIREQN